jgi:FkbM family methyltransferase
MHPRIADDLQHADIVTHGVRMRLDLRDYIQRRIFYESHEPRPLAFCERCVRPGDVVLDVGAHVGIFTLVSASRARPGGAVHAFEPVPANYASLADNVRLNGFGNIVLNRAAAGDEEGEISLGLPKAVPDSGPTSAMYTAGGGERAVTAPTVVLDSYAEAHLGATPIRLLKIDAEGSEPAVLAGFSQRLASAPPDVVLVEINLELLDRHGYGAEDVLGPLRDAGYRFLRESLLGRLSEFEPDFSESFDRNRDVPRQEPGVVGWLRRYRAESRIFLNVYAVQPLAQGATGVD